MIQDLMREYLSLSADAASLDFSDKEAVDRFNSSSDRMRSIIDEVVKLGRMAILEFSSLLDHEPAANWVAHHLVEKADLDTTTLARCFTRVEQAVLEAKARGHFADAMGEEMWLKEWRGKKL